MIQADYSRVSVIEGGFNRWREVGYPTESSQGAQAAWRLGTELAMLWA